MSENSNILIYQNESGNIKVDVRFEGELLRDAVIRNYRITVNDGKNYDVLHYNLDMITAIFEESELERNSTVRNYRTVEIEG